jgi:hypothetical protein
MACPTNPGWTPSNENRPPFNVGKTVTPGASPIVYKPFETIEANN